MADFYSSKTRNNAIAYVNGKVFTMNQNAPWASGFIVSSQGIFEAVGTDIEITKIAGLRHLAIYDLKRQFIMPGIHDAHTHLLMAGEAKMWQVNIGECSDERALASRLKERMYQSRYTNVVGNWIVSNFYVPAMFPNGRPDRKYLDETFPSTPVMVREMSLHKVLLNSEALRQLHIDTSLSEPPSGGIYVRREDGVMTGELFETATTTAWVNLPKPPLAIVKESIQYAIKICHQYGITSVQEASANTLYLHALRELEEEKRLNMDIHTHIVCQNEFIPRETTQSLEKLLDIAEAFKSKHIEPRCVKFWLDGSPVEPGSTHCQLTNTGEPDATSLFFDNKSLLSAVSKYDARDFICKMHASGEGSVRQALDIYEALRAANPNGPRHEIAHSNAIHEDDFIRLARLRVTAEMSPSFFHQVDSFQQTGNILRWEFDQVHRAGGMTTIGSDWPVTDSPDLLRGVAGLVSKITVDPYSPGRSAHVHSGKPANEISGPIICRLLTLGAAEALGRGDSAGSIEVGKKAHFVAFSRDLSKGEFQDAYVLRTWFEGRMVFDRELEKE